MNNPMDYKSTPVQPMPAGTIRVTAVGADPEPRMQHMSEKLWVATMLMQGLLASGHYTPGTAQAIAVETAGDLITELSK